MKFKRVMFGMFIVMALLTAFNCKKSEVLKESFDILDALHVSRTGGGQIEYSITRSSENFQVDVVRFDGKETNLLFYLRVTDGDSYSSVTDVFEGNIDLKKERYVPTRRTGTWTNIRLCWKSGLCTEIDHMANSDTIHVIDEFVYSKLEKY